MSSKTAKIFYSNYFPYLIITKTARKIALNSFSVLHKLSRGYAALRVRLRPTNSKKDRQNYSEFIFHTTKTGGGRGFAVSRRRESYGKNLPLGQIDERRHLEVFGKSVSGLCRVTSPFTPPPIRKRHAELRAVFVLVGAVGLEPITSTMSR